MIALFGPLIAPHSPDAIVGIPYTDPRGGNPLGTDFLGRDVLSRILWGGRDIVLVAGVATAIGYMIGATIGLLAGQSRSIADPALMRSMDVLLAFPPILFLLVLATGAGPSTSGADRRDRDNPAAGHRPRDSRGDDGGQRSWIRRGGDGAGRIYALCPVPGDPPEHPRHDSGRCGTAADTFDTADRGGRTFSVWGPVRRPPTGR